MAAAHNAINQLMEAMRQAGAMKLAWSLERRADGAEARWECELQASNEMGAPITLPPEIVGIIEEFLRSGQLGKHEPGVWVMDTFTGDISRPHARTGEGATAPGIAERAR